MPTRLINGKYVKVSSAKNGYLTNYIKKDILFEESAVKRVLKHLKTLGYVWNNIKYVNKGRYCIVFGNPNIAILLKSEPFMTYGFKFRELGRKGVGDTVNCEHLREFKRNSVEVIYTMFRDGKIYCINLDKFLKESDKWENKEGKEVRSISIHLYKRVNPEVI